MPHAPQHALGAPHFGYGPPNLIHNFDPAEHEYGYQGQGDVYGAGITHGGAFERRSYTDVRNGPVSAQENRSEGTDKRRFTTAQVPRYIQKSRDPGLRKEIVVSG